MRRQRHGAIRALVWYTYTGPAPAPPLKLFQPTHLRFYLVASSLTCRKAGLPDHTLDTSAGEAVAFTVRQLRPKPGYTNADCAVYDPAKCTEYAWIPVTAGASASTTATAPAINSPAPQPGWIQATGASPMPGEEQIPFILTHMGSNGNTRRIFLGLIPASRRQQYIGAQTLSANGSSNGSGASSSNGTPADPRMDMFYRQIIGPWCNLLDWWKTLAPSSTSKNECNAQLASALILLDFATFLQQNLPSFWNAVTGTTSTSSLSSAQITLYNTLGSSLLVALAGAYQYGAQLEAIGPDNTLPTGYVPYALTDPANMITPTTLQTPVSNALPPLASVNVPVLPPLAQKPSNAMGDYYFIVRCVYLRPQCSCNVISPPCQPFLLANHFDPDAPARRIQVALPVDTSAATLRKYDKGTAFMFSDELRNQMARVTSLSALTNGSFGSPGVGIGWICSFSIPIITICAMILLFVIVIALNIVFSWIPFFKICLPVPQLKGKS